MLFPCVLLCDQVKFKWRIVEARIGARNAEPRTPPPPLIPPHRSPPTLDARFGVPHSHVSDIPVSSRTTPPPPFTSASTPSPRCLLHFASIPYIPFSNPSTLPPLHTLPPLQSPRFLCFASTPYIQFSHPSTLPQSPCLLSFASTRGRHLPANAFKLGRTTCFFFFASTMKRE